jgi:type I restriction enzyme, S subunit
MLTPTEPSAHRAPRERLRAEWPKITLAELAVVDGIVGGPFGSELVRSDYVPSGVPVIRGTNIADNRFDPRRFVYVSEAKADSLARNHAIPGDIVVTQRGTLGQVAIVPDLGVPRYVISQSQMRLRCDPARASPRFVYYWLSSPEVVRYIHANAVAAGVPHINLGFFKQLRIPLPSLAIQDAIVEVLGALDDKIELNRQTCATLESMAQALFRAWFVDCEGGMTTPLGEVADINPPRRLARGTTAAHVEMASLSTTGHRPRHWTRREAGSGARFMNGDTLVARITPCLENGKAGYVDFLTDGEVGWGSTEYLVIRPREPLPPLWGYLLARSEAFRDYAIQHLQGSTGRQRVPAPAIARYPVVQPPERVARAFAEQVEPWFAQASVLDEQGRSLAQLRDSLLPRLLAGTLSPTEQILD